MANIKFNKKIFEKEIGKLDEAMQNKIAMFGTTLEQITDNEIEIEVNPNRPDLLSYSGFKRSFLNFLEKTKGLKKYELKKPEKNYEVIVDSSVKEVRPYTACAIVKKLNLNNEKIKELIDMQEKLHFTVGRKRKKFAIGIYPLEKIKLPITYTALEPDKIKFIPLEATREMSGLEILQRHPTGRDYAHLLAGKSKFPVFIDADKNILSMPPIINSQSTGKITEGTKEVFVECSGFDLWILEKCLNIVVTSLAEIGGEIYQMKVGSKITPDLKTEKRKISIENTNKLLGLDLNEKQVKKFLEKMGHNYSDKEVETPSWRVDVLHEVDLIEDIAIAYGYDNFVPELPQISTIGQENQKEVIKKKISEILSGLNMLEISNYHLTNRKDQFEKMGILEKQEKDFIEVEESKTDYNFLRKDLTHYLLKTFSENTDSEYPQRIFETGRIFELNNANKIIEREKLSAALVSGNFTELKQILLHLFNMLNIEVKLKEPEKFPMHFIDGRVAEIILGEEKIGYLGEIHPKILKNWKIKMPVALFEIELASIFARVND
ncbi:MAG: phenylalanine--tRNA ligase subunit beta [Nanoarchaeota archaeon]|nr:phenylalanine--tRNA ligase subunit beta [Nanoarchaeota archaeon]